MFLLSVVNSYSSYSKSIMTCTIFCYIIIIIRIYPTTIILFGRATTNLKNFVYYFSEYFLQKAGSAMCLLDTSHYYHHSNKAIKHGKKRKNKLIHTKMKSFTKRGVRLGCWKPKVLFFLIIVGFTIFSCVTLIDILFSIDPILIPSLFTSFWCISVLIIHSSQIIEN